MTDLITLTTDFGVADAYVAAMKGVIKSINPRADVVDITHEIAPQDILQASYVLGSAYTCFPPSTVHVVVVDPGVGTERRAILLVSPIGLFLAPDNGALSHVLMDVTPEEGPSGHELFAPYQRAVPPNAYCYSLSEPKWWRPNVSRTFHGRDVFAPVAARLSMGLPPSAVGNKINSFIALNLPQARRLNDGALLGYVVHIDGFGNLVTNIKKQDVSSQNVVIRVKDARIEGLSPSYQAGGELLAIIGSNGALEIALKEGNAQKKLGVQRGAQVIVRLRG